MEPAGDAVLRRDWHTMSPVGQQAVSWFGSEVGG